MRINQNAFQRCINNNLPNLESDDPKTAPCGVAAEAIDNDISFESPLLCKIC